MKSRTTERFWKLYAPLPTPIKTRAKAAYRQFQRNPYHPGLRFKRIHSTRPIFSARINKDYRAVGVQQDGEIIWFWIGSHAEYDKLVVLLRGK